MDRWGVLPIAVVVSACADSDEAGPSAAGTPAARAPVAASAAERKPGCDLSTDPAPGDAVTECRRRNLPGRGYQECIVQQTEERAGSCDELLALIEAYNFLGRRTDADKLLGKYRDCCPRQPSWPSGRHDHPLGDYPLPDRVREP